MALTAYRNILRSTRIAFQGDIRILSAARQTARQNFDSNRSLSPSDAEAVAAIVHAEEVAKVLRRHVVQGEQVGEEGVETGGRYQTLTFGLSEPELRIHSEIERGDNATIKMAGKDKNVGQISKTSGCCGRSR